MPPSTDEPANVFASLEELEMRRRLPRALAQLGALVAHIQHIRLQRNPEPLPERVGPVPRSTLLEGLVDAVRQTRPAGVSDSLVRRMARAIGDHLLWRPEPTTPVVHELVVLAPWWLGNMPGEVFARLRDIGLEYVLNGAVKPVQDVWRELLEAPLVFMSQCTCRTSRVSEDLYADAGQVYTRIDVAGGRLLLDRFTDRFERLWARHGGQVPDCDPAFVEIGLALARSRRDGAPDYRLETLLERTFPYWEFLPVLDAYTPSWLHSLHANRKARLLHKQLAFELATALYAGKGVVFSTMQLFDQPYCICSCPTPENGGGCVLTSWYYTSRSDASLLPSDAAHGRRRDAHGTALPCNQFPIRSTRLCIGCGCDHEHAEPHGLRTLLAQADRYLPADA